jgi:hypothetical protein
MTRHSIRLVQFIDANGERSVALASADGAGLAIVDGARRVIDLAEEAVFAGRSLAEMVLARTSPRLIDYAAVIAEGRVLPPVDHPEPSRMHITGTGLTHLGSAATRDQMHQEDADHRDERPSDSMVMFRWGLEGGRPENGEVGVQPEWFYKGNGHTVVAPEGPLRWPGYAEDGGEEPELALAYWIGPDGTPFRIGAALGNEFSDHIMEKRNYLYLAHSKLRESSFGPELIIGSLPGDIRGTSRVRRNGKVVWERPFLTGEDNMSHSLANLEHHHFKYAHNRVPGDVHIHFLGTATLSFADGFRAKDEDIFEIEAPGFGRPLRNRVERARGAEGPIGVRAL